MNSQKDHRDDKLYSQILNNYNKNNCNHLFFNCLKILSLVFQDIIKVIMGTVHYKGNIHTILNSRQSSVCKSGKEKMYHLVNVPKQLNSLLLPCKPNWKKKIIIKIKNKKINHRITNAFNSLCQTASCHL